MYYIIPSRAAIARNVSAPFGAPYKTFGVYNAEYRGVADLTRLYFFELTTAPNVIRTDEKNGPEPLRCAASTRTRLR